MRLTDDIRQRFAFTRDLDRRAKAIREATGCDLPEAYARAIEETENAGESSEEAA